ncbi:hypothetical protein HHK36_026238 [Tetracentron sinense]|uniref:Uncharacterized protein n=1 Tax=Tetracentron sinense TaxID=13715 RepID=A0A834YEP9_TETSI|nr:hypothetical protein HHK36_026238 [Tetracentron sinense]
MASDETMTMHEDEFEIDDCIYEDDQHHPPHNFSRLSMCTSSSKRSMSDNDDDDDDDAIGIYMSCLLLEGSDGDADEEFSDDKEGKGGSGVSSDSDQVPGCYSLPATPTGRRVGDGSVNQLIIKEYASENEAEKLLIGRKSIVTERWLERAWDKKKHDDEEMEPINHRLSGESECLVITRPKGGRRSLCMDIDEVKACRDLGFELEHERMLEFSSRISISTSTIDTTSGGNSPIANWRISSPGDDPRDVKARLKVWAQAVALASTSQTL